jgi:pimeloyl-ACP methyl ester carboxylesterase
MLAFDRQGEGAPLLLLHGTNSSRKVWEPIIPQLSTHREVISVDLPAHGDSPPCSYNPPAFARDIAVLLEQLELGAPAIVGHSVGGWTALELAKLGHASAVLALAPAGLWRRRSPLLTDLGLSVNWRLGRLLGTGTVGRTLSSGPGRRLGLWWITARPADVPLKEALQTAHTAIRSEHFPEHFRQTRALRFQGGAEISPSVAVRVIWGARDHVAPARRSRHSDQLPAHARIETWPDCGHMTMWDRPRDTVSAALEISSPQPAPS